MLARGIEVSHEAIRVWTLRFGTEYARRLRRRQGVEALLFRKPLKGLRMVPRAMKRAGPASQP